MFAALAHRVVVLPSTAFVAAQQEPLDDAVTGLLRDSNCSAAGAPPGAARAIAPPSTAIEIAAPPARMASALPRSFIPKPPLCKPLRRLTRTIERAQCGGESSLGAARVFSGTNRIKATICVAQNRQTGMKSLLLGGEINRRSVPPGGKIGMSGPPGFSLARTG